MLVRGNRERGEREMKEMEGQKEGEGSSSGERETGAVIGRGLRLGGR
jgi:hypothetical protein